MELNHFAIENIVYQSYFNKKLFVWKKVYGGCHINQKLCIIAGEDFDRGKHRKGK